MQFYLIGSNIRKHRIFAGKKQETFAMEIGISRVMLSRYENGHTSIKFETMQLIAKALGIKVEDLYMGYK